MQHRHKSRTVGYNPRRLLSNSSTILRKSPRILSRPWGFSAQRPLPVMLPVPADHEMLIKQRDSQIPDASITRSSACWRKYLGTWEVKDGRLYLVRIEGILKVKGSSPVFAQWFSGELRVPRGEIIQYAHMGYHSLHEEDMFILIEEGIVKKSWIRDNRSSQKEKPADA